MQSASAGARPFRVAVGDVLPAQQSQTTCGSASLTIARMLVNPAFARWINDGIDRDGLPTPTTKTARFAAYERVVQARTNALHGAGGRVQLPWPRALGTPPWGAAHELEHGASQGVAAYGIHAIRSAHGAERRDWFQRMEKAVAEGRPGLLYVGSPRLPRHVTLVLPDEIDGTVHVYEPAAGRVLGMTADGFADEAFGLAGWPQPWFLVLAE